MSIVTGILLTCSVSDDQTLRAVVARLKQRTSVYGPDSGVELNDLDPDRGGTYLIGRGRMRKHPQFDVAVSGANFFDEFKDDFVQDVLTAPWRWPGNVILILKPEDGPTEVFRPAFDPNDY